MSWVQPDSHTANDWENAADAYDEDTETYASHSLEDGETTTALDLHLDEAIEADDIRAYFTDPDDAAWTVKVYAYYNDDWQQVFYEPVPTGEYVNVAEAMGTQTVSAVRFEFEGDDSGEMRVHDVAFNEVEIPTVTRSYPMLVKAGLETTNSYDMLVKAGIKTTNNYPMFIEASVTGVLRSYPVLVEASATGVLRSYPVLVKAGLVETNKYLMLVKAGLEQTLSYPLHVEAGLSGITRQYPLLIEASATGVTRQYPLYVAVTQVYGYTDDGYRISPPLNVGDAEDVVSTDITWTSTEPGGTDITIETALSDGIALPSTWQEATSGSAIPGISAGDDLQGKYLWVRQKAETQDNTITPALHSLTVTITYNKTIYDGEEMILQKKEHDVTGQRTRITCGDIILSDSELLARILDELD